MIIFTNNKITKFCQITLRIKRVILIYNTAKYTKSGL